MCMKAKFFDYLIRLTMIVATSFAVIVPLGILTLLIVKSVQFFKMVPISEFLFGVNWAPRDDIVRDHFGVLPVLMGSISTATIAIITTVIIGFAIGCYLAEYTTKKQHYFLRVILDMFSGIPSIVYAFFVAVTCTPYFVWLANSKNTVLHFDPESALVIGFFIGILTVPFFAALVDDALKSAPKRLYDAALSLGTTKTEVMFDIIIPYVSKQLMSSFLFALSRCFGETVIAMIAGSIISRATLNPLISNSTATAQIVTLAMSDSDFASPRALSTFALALLLFCFTFIINTIGGYIEHKK